MPPQVPCHKHIPPLNELLAHRLIAAAVLAEAMHQRHHPARLALGRPDACIQAQTICREIMELITVHCRFLPCICRSLYDSTVLSLPPNQKAGPLGPAWTA